MLNTRVVSGSAKQVPHSFVERIIFVSIGSADVFHGMTSCHSQALYSFYCSTSARLARRFPWHVLSKQRSCPLIPGFSSIRAWVTQPCLWYDSLIESESQTVTGRALGIHLLYKGTKARLPSSQTNQIRPSLRVPTPKALVLGASDLRRCPAPTFKAGGCLPPLRKKMCES